MKNILRKALLIVALMTPSWAAAQSDTLMVANELQTSSTIPFYGYWIDADVHNQIIYPGNLLTNIVGDSIKGIGFYMSSPNETAWGASVTIKLGITSNSGLSALDLVTPLTQVYEGTVDGASSQIWIEFDEAYPYQGGNLLMDISTSGGTFSTGEFFGMQVNNASFYTYLTALGNYGSGVISFVPRTSFVHVEGDFDVCPMLEHLYPTLSGSQLHLMWPAPDSSYTVFLNGDTVEHVTDSFYTFTGLQPNTWYTFGVATECSNNTSPFLVDMLKTPCLALNQLPYIESFENAATGSNNSTDFDVDCWNRLTDATTYPYAYINSGSNYNHTAGGSKGIYWYRAANNSAAYGTYNCFVMPAIDTSVYDLGNINIHFWARNSTAAAAPRFYIGMMSDPDDITTFDTVAEIDVSGNTWSLYGTALTAYSGNGTHPAISCDYTGANTYTYIDDLTISEGWCEMPQNVTSEPDTASIYFTWEPNGGSSFAVFVGGDTVTGITDTFYTFTGLAANTTYNYGVASECYGLTSLFNTGEVKTLCKPINVLPWSESFESYAATSSSVFGFIPCWGYLNNATSYFHPFLSSNANFNHTAGGSKAVYWFRSASPSYGQYAILALPPIETETFPINTLQLKFWAKIYTSGTATPTLVIGAMSDPDDESTFDTVQILSSFQTDWNEFTVPFTSYTGQGSYIAVRGNITTGTWYLCLDDFSVEALPSCPAITDLSIGGTTVGAAIATWSYQEGIIEPSGYDVMYGPTDGSAAATTESVTENNIALTGLTPGTQYYVKVRTTCYDGDGVWDSITFQTTGFGCQTLSSTPVNDTIGSGSTTTQQLPSNGYYKYNLSQQVYTKSEMGQSGSITSIAVMPSQVSANRNIEIYMGHTPLTSVGSFTHPADMVKVYNGYTNMETADQWYTFNLDTPFFYDTAMGNLLVCFRDLTGSYTSNYNYYYTHTNSNGNSVYANSDNGPYDAFTATGGTSTSMRNNMLFVSAECLVQAACASPSVTPISVGSDSVVVGWIPGYDDVEWDVDYRPANDSVWTNVACATSDLQYTITGLSANTEYVVRVTNDCDGTPYAGETTFRTGCGLLTLLPYSESFEGYDLGSATGQDFIPCWFYLSDATSYFYPYVNSGLTYNHTSGGSQGLYWYGGTSTSYGNYSMAILPGVDTELYPINTLMLSFWAKKTSATALPTFIVGAMSDPTDNTTFVPCDTVVLEGANTGWTKYNVRFSDFNALSCNHVAIRTELAEASWTAYVDDITLKVMPPCENVENVKVSAGPTSAVVSWDAIGNYQGAIVEYRDTINNTWYATTVTGQTYALLTDLYPNMPYALRVTAICGEDTLSDAVSRPFSTKDFACVVYSDTQFVSDTVGTGTSTSSYLPGYCYYNYAISQQIYTATEVGGAGKIASLAIRPAVVGTPNRTIEIYLGHTASTTLSSYEHPTDLTKVYDGTATFVEGAWYTFVFDTDFVFNGSDNLLVCFRDMTGSYSSNYNYFYTHSIPNYSLYSYQDAAPYDPYTTSGGTTMGYRNNMIFTHTICDSVGICAAPPATVTTIGTTTVDVAWTHGNVETSWNVYYRLHNADSWTTAAMGVTDSNYQFANLMSGYAYDFRIEAVCDQMLSSVVSATTGCAAIGQLPFTEDFSGWGTGSGTLPNCWSKVGSYSSYPYISATYNHSVNEGGSLYMFNSSSAALSSFIALPPVETSLYQANELEVTFYAYRTTSTSYAAPAFIVGVQENAGDPTSFTPVDTVYHTAGPGMWQFYVVPLTAYSGDGAYVAIHTLYTTASFATYIDDLTLELTPACPRVEDLNATSISPSAVGMGWTDNSGSTTTWQIAYGPFGFEPENGTLVTAMSNPFTLNNPACGSGHFYVRPICSNGDTGYWSLEAGTFYVGQTAATVPYYYDFESPEEWSNWQGSYNKLSHVWARGTAVKDSGNYSMYITADQGATYKPYSNNAIVNAATFRDFDFGTIDSSFTLTFRARVGGTINGVYDALMVLLVDADVTPVASNEAITSPWGAVSSLDPLAVVRLDTTWQTYTANLDNISGTQRLAFFWFNQSTMSSEALNEPAAIDNIRIDYSPCPRPSNLMTIAAGVHNATITWIGPSDGEYEVVYRLADNNGTNQFTTTSTNMITLTGLDSLATYYIWVRKVCGDDTSAYSIAHEFTTTLCDNGVSALNYNGTMEVTTSSYSPIGYSFYNYGYVQTLIDSAFMAGIGDAEIGYFGFNPASVTAGSICYSNMNVYMANVTESDLSEGWILPDANHVFKQVFINATFNFSQTGWQIHQMDSTFAWDGHSNVLVAIVRDHGSYASGPSFNAHTGSAVMTRYAYRDISGYNYTNPNVAGTGTTTSGDIMLISCDAGPKCLAPVNVYATGVTYESATLHWAGTAGSYELQYKASNAASWSSTTTTTENSFQLTNLAFATSYLVQVRSVCVDESTGDNYYSDWVEGSFTTQNLPCHAPTELTYSTVTYSTATLDWLESGVGASWNVRVWNSQFEQTFTTTSHPFTVSGLTPNTTYNVAVSTQCTEAFASDYSDTLTIQTLTCQPPTGLTVTEKTATSATITWNGSGVGFDVEYGDDHFSEGVNTHVVHVTDNTYKITGLEPNYDYSVSVRTECEAGVFSAYCAQVDFSTPAQGEGIESAGTANVTLYPNPTRNATTIAISGVNGEVEITIVDLSGRVVMTDSMSCTGDCAKKLEVSGLSQGAYFVRLSGENVNMVKKLIVK